MPISQRREPSKACGCRCSIGPARACSTSHEWRGSPPIEPSASTPKTSGKYRLNFPAIRSVESRNKGRDRHRQKSLSYVPLWQILLQKSVATGHGGWRDFLELAACHSLPSEGGSKQLPLDSALLMQSTPR